MALESTTGINGATNSAEDDCEGDIYLFTGVNCEMWDLFKRIIATTTEPKVKEIAEEGIELLKYESL